MCSLIQQEIAKSGYAEMLAAGIVLTGGTTLLQGMVELGDFLFEIPLKRGVPIRLGGLKEVVNSPKYSTAVGLLKYGAERLGSHPQQHSVLGDGLQSLDGVIGKMGASVRSFMKDLF
jgi:cell division protein FtsA